MRTLFLLVILATTSCTTLDERAVIPAVVGVGMMATGSEPAVTLATTSFIRVSYWLAGKEEKRRDDARAQAEEKGLHESQSTQE